MGGLTPSYAEEALETALWGAGIVLLEEEFEKDLICEMEDDPCERIATWWVRISKPCGCHSSKPICDYHRQDIQKWIEEYRHKTCFCRQCGATIAGSDAIDYNFVRI